MTRPAAKGWCPGALRPMLSGDGLLVRVRPKLGRLTAAQVVALCAAAEDCGNGLIDLTSRGNLQMRGVTPESHGRLLAQLEAAELIDESPELESRNNILVAPTWARGDDTWRIATELGERLAELPDLPTKFGFAVDAGERPMLACGSADVRVERGRSGDLIVRLDGREVGERSTSREAVERIIEICHWFVATGGGAQKRMARHGVRRPRSDDDRFDLPADPGAALEPGTSPLGPVYGAPFGRLGAGDLAALMRASGATALRTTPWRVFLLEGGRAVEHDAFSADPADPLLRVAACPGAPFCASSSIDTRALARELSSVVPGGLHVSGCAKGCAQPSPATVTVVGREGTFDIVRGGCAWDAPDVSGLVPADVVAQLGGK